MGVRTITHACGHGHRNEVSDDADAAAQAAMNCRDCWATEQAARIAAAEQEGGWAQLVGTHELVVWATRIRYDASQAAEMNPEALQIALIDVEAAVWWVRNRHQLGAVSSEALNRFIGLVRT